MSQRSERLIDITCVVKMRKGRGIAIADGTMEPTERGGEREKWFWLPAALVEENADGTVTLSEWLAIDKELV